MSWEYDAHGNLTKEVNALGEAIIKSYDDNDHLVFQQGPRFNYHLRYVYDYSNRLIREEEIHTNDEANKYKYKSKTVESYEEGVALLKQEK
jgi:YD repeat-containing protein